MTLNPVQLMPIVKYMNDRILFPDFMSGDEISDVLGAIHASAQAVGEFAATLGSSAIAEPIAGLTGLATSDPSAVGGMQQRLTYQPRTRAGQMAMQSIAKDVQNLSEATGLQHVSGYWRDRVVPALQEYAGPVAGSALAAGGLAALTAISEISPQGRAVNTARRQIGAIGDINGLNNKAGGAMDKQSIVDGYAQSNPKAMEKIYKKVGKNNLERQYALVKQKQNSSAKLLEDSKANTIKAYFDRNNSEAELINNGFEKIGSNVSGREDLSSLSSYYKNPQTGRTARISDHAPVHSRSANNDILIHPGSHESAINIADQIQGGF